MIGALFHETFYRPLVNLLVFFYQSIPPHDLGVSIILVTIAIRLALYPLTAKSLKAQRDLAAIQPEIKALQEKHKDNKEEQAKRLMALYKEKGVNPLGGCLPILIQLPLLIALYRVFADATGGDLLSELYRFVPRPEMLSPIAFGFLDLSRPNLALAALAGISQFFQAYFMPPAPAASSDFQRAMQTQMLYVLPIFIAVISMRFPAALALYWVVLNAVSILQQIPLLRKANS